MFARDHGAASKGIEVMGSLILFEAQPAGMAAMSQKFKDMGGQVYVDAERVKESNKSLG
jgi:hypothetical protein